MQHRRRLRHTAAPFVLPFMVAWPGLPAQPALPRGSAPTTVAPQPDSGTTVVTRIDCAACRVQLTRVVTLGDSAGPGALGASLYAVARDGAGRYLVATGLTNGVGVYDASGRFVRRITIGPDTVPDGSTGNVANAADSAAAPFRSAAVGLVALGAADTVHLLDERRRKHLVLAPHAAGYGVVRTRPLPQHPGGSWFALLLPNDELLATGDVPDREHIGLPLHRVTAEGVIGSSFGADVARRVPGEASGFRVLAAADSGRVWAAHLSRYRLERWTLDGARDRAIARVAPWFTPPATVRPLGPDSPPRPQLLAVHQDAAGRLWTLARVADPAWRTTLRRVADRRGRAAYAAADLERLVDTVVEVFDPACGRLLASQRAPGLLARFIGDGHIAGWRATRGARPRLDVWRVELLHPQQEISACATTS